MFFLPPFQIWSWRWSNCFTQSQVNHYFKHEIDELKKRVDKVDPPSDLTKKD